MKQQFRIGYDKADDMMVIYIRSNENEEWGYMTGYPYEKINDNDEETEYIHFSAIQDIKRLVAFGYEMVL